MLSEPPSPSEILLLGRSCVSSSAHTALSTNLNCISSLGESRSSGLERDSTSTGSTKGLGRVSRRVLNSFFDDNAGACSCLASACPAIRVSFCFYLTNPKQTDRHSALVSCSLTNSPPQSRHECLEWNLQRQLHFKLS